MRDVCDKTLTFCNVSVVASRCMRMITTSATRSTSFARRLAIGELNMVNQLNTRISLEYTLVVILNLNGISTNVAKWTQSHKALKSPQSLSEIWSWTILPLYLVLYMAKPCIMLVGFKSKHQMPRLLLKFTYSNFFYRS